jgi:hypothetical protein
MVAGRARDFYEKQAKERMSEGGKNKGVENLPPLGPTKARDAAGKAFNVSRIDLVQSICFLAGVATPANNDF